MATFVAKKIKGAGQEKYYPVAKTLYAPAEIKDLAKLIEKSSTVAEADILAVLNALPLAMTTAFNQGRTVKLQGLGTFRATIDVKRGAGKTTAEAVDVNDILKTNIRFLPESTWDAGRNVQTRSIVSGIEWVKIADTPAATTGETGSDDTQSEDDPYNPFGG